MKTKPQPEVSAAVVMKALQREAQPAIRKVSDLVIDSQKDFDTAGELLRKVKDLAAEAKAKEDSLTQPLTKVVADIRTLFRPFRDMVKAVEEDTKIKMLEFVAEQKKQAKKLEKDFASGKIKKVSTLVTKTGELEVHNGAAQVRKVWTAIPVNEKLTPREFLSPDVTKIKEALKSGKKVAGWKWEQIETIAV